MRRAAMGFMLWCLLGGSCQGGSGGGSKGGSGVPNVQTTQVCDGGCSQENLSADQVKVVISQAVAQVVAIGAPPATIAVVDHVGNVLALYQMSGAAPRTTITTLRGVTTGLEGFEVPSTLAAISKAGTAAYLSTQGNAFTTRTASQIVQQNFNPNETDQPGGPLFGVQFSQLPCGDLVGRLDRGPTGPQRMPLGFSADPGGIPLYINGVPVGGVGVEFNGLYTADPDISDVDTNPEERVAVAASRGFDAPEDRRADRIAVAGRLLRFADDEKVVSTSIPAFSALAESLVPDLAPPRFFNASRGVLAGTPFLTPSSGIVRTTSLLDGLEAEILVNSGGDPRYPPASSALPNGPSAEEARVILREALRVAARSRAQIRRPAGSAARVSVFVVDAAGAILGAARSPDAPPFGIDVALQKARTAAYFSSSSAANDLRAADATPVGITTQAGALALLGEPSFDQYIQAAITFTSGQVTLNGDRALSNRAVGNLARPFFPDGINGRPNGPFSRPFSQWSPFSTGLQLDLVFLGLGAFLCPYDTYVQRLGASIETLFTRLAGGCPTGPAAQPTSCTTPSLSEIPNGVQIFAGSVPIYRGQTLIGGVGVSGDGIDQDDMVAFLGLHNAGLALGGTLGNAPSNLRADKVSVQGTQLRYVNCPVAPFRDSNEQSPCDGK